MTHRELVISKPIRNDDFEHISSGSCAFFVDSNGTLLQVVHEHLDLDRLRTYVHNCLEGSKELPETDAMHSLQQADQGSSLLPDNAVCADQQSRLHDAWRYHQQHRFPCTVLQDAQDFLIDVLADDPA
jgi:hypothetical protein